MRFWSKTMRKCVRGLFRDACDAIAPVYHQQLNALAFPWSGCQEDRSNLLYVRRVKLPRPPQVPTLSLLQNSDANSSGSYKNALRAVLQRKKRRTE